MPIKATGHCSIRRESGFVKISEKPIQKKCRTSTCCAADFPASLFQLLETAEGLGTQEVPCSLKLPDWLRQKDLRICCLKMFPDCLTMTGAGRLRPSSIRWTDWGMVWNGRCLTARISMSPSPAAGCTTGAAETSLVQVLPEAQGERVYAPEGVSCTLSAQPGGFGGKTGLYAVGPSAESGFGNKHKATYAGANVRLADFKQNSLLISCEPCVPCFVDLNEDPKFTAYSRCLTAKQDSGLHRHKREASGVWDGRRIHRLTPREYLRLQDWRDERIEKVLPLHADTRKTASPSRL